MDPRRCEAVLAVTNVVPSVPSANTVPLKCKEHIAERMLVRVFFTVYEKNQTCAVEYIETATSLVCLWSCNNNHLRNRHASLRVHGSAVKQSVLVILEQVLEPVTEIMYENARSFNAGNIILESSRESMTNECFLKSTADNQKYFLSFYNEWRFAQQAFFIKETPENKREYPACILKYAIRRPTDVDSEKKELVVLSFTTASYHKWNIPQKKEKKEPAEEPDKEPDKEPVEESDEKPDEKPAEESDEKPDEEPDEEPDEDPPKGGKSMPLVSTTVSLRCILNYYKKKREVTEKYSKVKTDGSYLFKQSLKTVLQMHNATLYKEEGQVCIDVPKSVNLVYPCGSGRLLYKFGFKPTSDEKRGKSEYTQLITQAAASGKLSDKTIKLQKSGRATKIRYIEIINPVFFAGKDLGATTTFTNILKSAIREVLKAAIYMEVLWTGKETIEYSDINDIFGESVRTHLTLFTMLIDDSGTMKTFEKPDSKPDFRTLKESIKKQKEQTELRWRLMSTGDSPMTQHGYMSRVLFTFIMDKIRNTLVGHIGEDTTKKILEELPAINDVGNGKHLWDFVFSLQLALFPREDVKTLFLSENGNRLFKSPCKETGLTSQPTAICKSTAMRVQDHFFCDVAELPKKGSICHGSNTFAALPKYIFENGKLEENEGRKNINDYDVFEIALDNRTSGNGKKSPLCIKPVRRSRSNPESAKSVRDENGVDIVLEVTDELSINGIQRTPIFLGQFNASVMQEYNNLTETKTISELIDGVAEETGKLKSNRLEMLTGSLLKIASEMLEVTD